MLADNQPGYPMISVIQLQLAGQVDRPAFEGALAEALQRHPLLRALIKTAKRGLPCWTVVGVPPTPLKWSCGATPDMHDPDVPIDLSKEVGLRIAVHQGTDRATVTLHIHHACTDGTGVYRFIGDISGRLRHPHGARRRSVGVWRGGPFAAPRADRSCNEPADVRDVCPTSAAGPTPILEDTAPPTCPLGLAAHHRPRKSAR